MDWDDIDPSDMNYYEAVYQATMERCKALPGGMDYLSQRNLNHCSGFAPLDNINNGVTLTHSGFYPFFYNIDYLLYNIIYSDYAINHLDQPTYASISPDNWIGFWIWSRPYQDGYYEITSQNYEPFYNRVSDTSFDLYNRNSPISIEGLFMKSDWTKQWLRSKYEQINLLRKFKLITSVSGGRQKTATKATWDSVSWSSYSDNVAYTQANSTSYATRKEAWFNVEKIYMPRMDGTIKAYGPLTIHPSLSTPFYSEITPSEQVYEWHSGSFSVATAESLTGEWALPTDIKLAGSETYPESEDVSYWYSYINALFEPDFQFKDW
jgi:hypothetical protein